MDNYIFELNANVSRTTVHYHNRFGIRLAGDVYLPKQRPQTKLPALIIGAPYGGVKEQSPGLYANELAQRGFAVLTFDPSFNGYSDGTPRHISSPEVFTEDFSAGVDYMGTREYVDRNQIGVLGICGSGGFALSAAQVDRRIKAIATVSMYDISRVQRYGLYDSQTTEQRNAFLDLLGEQRYAEFEGASEAVLTPRGAAIGFDDTTDPISREFGEFYSTPRGYHHNALSQFTMTSSLSFNNFDLLNHLEAISPRPVLLIVGENAHSKYFSDDVYAKLQEPKEELVIPGAGHVDLYDNKNLIPFARLTDFFKEHLVK